MSLKFKEIFVFSALLVQISTASKFSVNSLAKPDAEKCRTRPKEFTIKGQNYFFSGNHPPTNREVGWLEARNLCRQYCMDTMSIETQEEFEMMQDILEDFLVGYIWTSGRVCDEKDCLKDKKYQPSNVNGWTWLHNNAKIPATSRNPPGWSFNPWSTTGEKTIKNTFFALKNFYFLSRLQKCSSTR
jgi:hypothetical protein